MIPRRWLLDEWREEFLVQAQLHELPGRTIGEALAEVDTHCADSGQSPDEAFGDPVRYAEALVQGLQPATASGTAASAATGAAGPEAVGARTEGHRRRWHRRPWAVAMNALGVLGGILALLEGLRALASGERGMLTIGMLVGTVAGAGAITFIGAVILRPGSRQRRAWLLPSMLAGFGLILVAQLVWDRPVVQMPGWVLLAAGALLLTLAWWPLLSGRLDNPVIDPRTGRSPIPVPRWVGPWARWGLPAMVVVVGIMLMLGIVVAGP